LIHAGSLKLSLLLFLWAVAGLGVLGSGCFVGFFVQCGSDFDCGPNEFCDIDGVCVFFDTCFSPSDCVFFDKAAEGSAETVPAMPATDTSTETSTEDAVNGE